MEPGQNKTQLKFVDGIFAAKKITPTVSAQQKIMVESVSTSSAPAVMDDNKRKFLRLAGIAGVGTLAAMLLPKKAQAFVFGSSPTSGVVGIKDASNTRINPATETTLAAMKTKTDLLTFDSGTNPANLKVNIAAIDSSVDIGLQNASNVTINPATEDGNLATIASNIPAKGQAAMNASMPVVIASNQTPIPVTGTFTGGGSSDPVGLKDTNATKINPATEDGIMYFRRMVKLMESQATVDSANRQRITIDALGAIGASIPVSGSLTTAGTVSTVTTVTSVTNMVTLAGQNQQMFQDPARNAFANGIRQNLIFS